MPPGPAAVALSGGADSAVLLWAAARRGDARAVHVDHSLPGSPDLEEAAVEVAERLRVELTVVRVRIATGASAEAMARDARHRALREVTGVHEWVAMGHTADDQAETVLGNLLRGAGATGLAGMAPIRGRLVHPLLDVWRSETRELAGLLDLPFQDDPANDDRSFRRNVIRHELIPDLERRFNPGLRRVLGRTAAAAADDEALAAERAGQVPVATVPGGVRLPAPLLATLPPAVSSRAVRSALRTVAGPHAGRARDVADVAAVARGDRPGVELPGGVVAAREGPWVVLLAVSTAGAPSPAGTLPVPGTLVASGIEAEAWIEDRPPHPWPLGRVPAVLDGDAVGLELALRTAETGDRLEIVGGSKSVHAALADAGIPARLRPGWPVWAAHGKLVRVAGIATAAWARPGPATQRFLWIVERMEQP